MKRILLRTAVAALFAASMDAPAALDVAGIDHATGSWPGVRPWGTRPGG